MNALFYGKNSKTSILGQVGIKFELDNIEINKNKGLECRKVFLDRKEWW